MRKKRPKYKSDSSEYRTWSSMKSRCYNKNHSSYKYYGEKNSKEGTQNERS